MVAAYIRAMISLIIYRFLSVIFSCGMLFLCLTKASYIQEHVDTRLNRSTIQQLAEPVMGGTDFVSGKDFHLHNDHLPLLLDLSFRANIESTVHGDEYNRFLRLFCQSLPQATCVVTMVIMAMMLQYQSKRIATLKRDIISMMGDSDSSDSEIQRISTLAAEKQKRFARNVQSIASVTKRIENAYIQLDKAKELHDSVYEDLRYWKQTWINQTAKIRQITPQQLSMLTRVIGSDMDKLQLQKKVIHKFIADTEFQFDDVFYKMRFDKNALKDVMQDIDDLQNNMGIHPQRSLQSRQ